MDFSFNERVAVMYGVENAVMLHNIYWWTEKNKANGRHFYEGRYWTYNTAEAFAVLFKFWTKKQVRRITESCEKIGALHVANFNESGYNRTKWYALSDDCAAIYVSENLQLPKQANAIAQMGKSMLPNGQMEMPKWANGNAQMGKCITDINTDINHIENTDRESAIKFLEINFPSMLEVELMKYKTDLGAEFKKFCADFDATITIELEGNKISWNGNALIARLGKFARNWVGNMQSKAKTQAAAVQQPQAAPATNRIELTRRGA